MLTCKDVATAIGRDDWRAAPRWRRLTLRVHLWMCPHCRRYAAQIRAIGRAVRTLVRARDEDPTVIDRLHETILNHPDAPRDVGDVGR